MYVGTYVYMEVCNSMATFICTYLHVCVRTPRLERSEMLEVFESEQMLQAKAGEGRPGRCSAPLSLGLH